MPACPAHPLASPSHLRSRTRTTRPHAPSYILRHHAPNPITSIHHLDDLLLAGDDHGRVSLTRLSHASTLCQWQAHAAQGADSTHGAILGVELWSAGASAIRPASRPKDLHQRQLRAITHARDNTLKVWGLPTPSRRHGGFHSEDSSSCDADQEPSLLFKLHVNSVNFCAFAMLPLSHTWLEEVQVESLSNGFHAESATAHALVAVPNTVEAAWIDIYHLPSCRRVAAAIGAPSPDEIKRPTKNRPGIVMSVQLFQHNHVDAAGSSMLALLVGYEDGRVALWEIDATKLALVSATSANSISTPGNASSSVPLMWALAWEAKPHVEAVMAVSVSPDLSFAISVGADARVVKYKLCDKTRQIVTSQESAIPSRNFANAGAPDARESSAILLVKKTKQQGRACVCISPDGRIVGTGGWDGAVRLYAACDLEELGALRYHKDTVQALAFDESGPSRHRGAAQRYCSSNGSVPDEEHESDASSISSAMSSDEEVQVRIRDDIVAAGKDGRISLWDLREFGFDARAPG